ncbi:AbfB domain-containing protein [Nonomuraea sp. NPDC051941]|uniref:AbfB domain-containing protein n=1 Tax=Nonomuraea sp. NPDC051941 TaxID=3364373 RepID=UPI0037CC2A36
MVLHTSRRSLLKAAAGIAVLPALPSMARASSAAAAFKHPGLLHTQADFDRIAAAVQAGAQPYKSGWDRLVANGHSKSTWKARPLETVVRGGTGQNYPQFYNDVHAAYQNALRWKISGEKAHGDAARDILNAWSGMLKAINGNADRFLAAGIYGYQFANAAELLRGYPGFDVERFQKMLLNVFYPANDRFLREHNGACITNYWANWDLCNMASVMAIGLFCDDQTKFERAVDYFKNGKGNGSIMNAIPFLHPGGLAQWQESGRDQGHTLMGIGLIGTIAEMAWNQGVDLYGYADNRIMKAAEYVAKYNLGQDVPFTTYKWGLGQNCAPREQPVISSTARGQDRPVWELLYNHYANRRGLALPYTKAYAERVRAEGGGGDYGPNSGGFDQLGFGTLLFTRAAASGGGGGGALPTGVTRTLQSINFPKEGIAASGALGVLGGPAPLRIVPGLADAKGYSFMDGDGRYLRHKDYRLRFDADNGTELFEQDATFLARPASGAGRVRLESLNYPGRFIRHRHHQLWLDKDQDTPAFRADSTFKPATS